MENLPENVLAVVQEVLLGSSRRICASVKSEQLPRQLPVPAEFDELWPEVQARISRALDFLTGKAGKVFSPSEYVELYTMIFNMCPRYSAQLYEHYKMILQSLMLTALRSLKQKNAEFLLKEFVMAWENHKVMVRLLSKFFQHLDVCYVAPKLLLPLRELGVSCFHDIVFEDLKTVLATTIMGMINNERDGENVDRALVKDVLEIFVHIGRQNLGLYMINFEQAFYKLTSDYYSKKTQSWISEDSLAEYMFKAMGCIQSEKERVAHYLHSSTGPKLLEVIMFELGKHGKHMLNVENSGCKELLLDGKHEDLSRMYLFFSMMEDGLSPLLKIFKEHVMEEGISLIKHATAISRKDFIHKAIELHDKLLKYVTNCFQNSPAFHKVLMGAFSVFCNEDIAGSSCPEMLAAFCDNILRNGGKEKLSDEAVEETLDKVVSFLTYVADKYLFLEFHRSNLAKRLLLFKNCNYEYERSLLSRLNQHLGPLTATSKMEAMLLDLTTAKEDHSDFKQHLRNDPELSLNIDLSVSVLRSKLWPSYKSLDINLPLEMVKCVNVFTNYYTSKHTPNPVKRKLTWIHAFGTCSIIANFDSKPIELIVSTYQAALLLLFEDADQLSVSEIVDQLNLPDADAMALLQSVSRSKCRILYKEPCNNQISQSDTFHFNRKFTHKMSAIKVPLPSVGKQNVIDAVANDKSLSIQACIVRIMKTHKTMSHQLLVAECVKHLSRKFKPERSSFKRQIDDLITREYLKRDPENHNNYQYVVEA